MVKDFWMDGVQVKIWKGKVEGAPKGGARRVVGGGGKG